MLVNIKRHLNLLITFFVSLVCLSMSRKILQIIFPSSSYSKAMPLCVQNNFDKGRCLIAGVKEESILASKIYISIKVETLLDRTVKYFGARLLIALYTMLTVSCCIVS